MKKLIAVKCKEGWHIDIIETRLVTHKQDVFTLARQAGLKVNTELLKYQKGQIFAD